MKQLQPHANSKDIDCAATLRHNHYHIWFLVPCDEKHKARLICQVNTADVASTVSSFVYCMGQAFIVAKWCIIHVSLKAEKVKNAECMPFKASEISLRNTTGIMEYKKSLCSLFKQTCNVTYDEWKLTINEITNGSHVCIMPAPDEQCPDRSFHCEDLSCIPQSKLCNNIIDCLHGDDEKDCADRSCEISGINCQMNCTWPECKCAAGYFQCDNGGCIPIGAVCDFENNCADGSDEVYCGNLLCAENQLPCADNKACFDEEKLLDGVEDCMDASDEHIEQSKTCPGSQCKDLTCIPSTWVNNGIPDCPYGEDEADFVLQRATGHNEWPCYGATLPCKGSIRTCYPEQDHCIYDTDSRGNIYTCRNAGHLLTCEDYLCSDMYKCPMSYCISFHRVCDGVIDCQDSSDESNCPMIPCPGMFHCAKEQVCIHAQGVCDGKIHCKMSLDDEKYCRSKIMDECRNCTDFPNTLHMSSLLEHMHVRKVFLQNSEIEDLVSGTGKQQSSIIVLNLGNNLITILPSFAFHRFQHLHYIFLNNNRISSILPSAFMNVGKLIILDLSYNVLSSLSASDFEGLHSTDKLDLSYNRILAVDENTFVEHAVLHSLFVTDETMCCMIPSRVVCVVEMTMSNVSCQDNLLYPSISYIVCAVTVIILFNNVLSICILLNDKRKHLILNLSSSDLLFSSYLTILTGADFYYKNRFSFYVNLWPSSVSCFLAMSSFLVSFQQSIFTLILISSHACILIAFPFKKEAYKYFIRALIGIWILVMFQLFLVISLQYFNQITVVSSHNFCQAPVLAPSIRIPFMVSSCLIYTLLMLVFCACYLCSIALIKRRDKSLTSATQGKQILKRKMIRKTTAVLVINCLSVLSVIIVECLMMAGIQIDDVVLISITLSIMSLSKICNPWIYTLHNWARQKLKI